ncbi:DNA polymerase interacting tetratricopeptide repeat-containing, protein of 47 kDa [Chelonus insularis]|uniref:DNA polymerase interacting tetratricopeptide repeat-containing, protein of 47 kDa n=1 Tax=Chelonus insularis TaxID=460826 RepID=UPI00158A80A3|nr:DNA polymerase interacting tetratricopeptide repeat-containing, protein of 47 kDa [Chelonus insularis]XP_034943229.1 DNA polymerase interacting tetratricopeptide repeat-containing, protein of 47 kDa [Chelonus insularis]XP_034943231.1 DNA polymerase interacting tetratricopeptide repeat-containing, protein of 47 kDa [Chelonus insularis]
MMTEVTNTKTKKKKWSEEERLELAAKLDAELDEYISNLERKSYTEGWPEDRWEEEMEKHPFFMKKAPEPGEELSPLIEGLQQLKYGEDENTPEELAANYKEDGNFNYKYKKYRLAILSYTEGIKTKCKDDDLRAQLYNNRAAAHFMLKNYRSSLSDCKRAIKLKPIYPKALARAVQCCYYSKNYDECIELADRYLSEYEPNKEISTLMTNALTERKKKQRDDRMQEKREKVVEEEENKLIQAIINRGIKIELSTDKKIFELKDLEPQIPQLAQYRVRFDQANRLVWPVMILYPETMQTDFIQNFYEDTPFMDQLEELFEEPPEWDIGRRYILSNLNVYFEGKNKMSIHKIDVSKTLGTIMKQEEFTVRGGTPSFLVLIASSDTEKRFLDNYKSLRSL